MNSEKVLKKFSETFMEILMKFLRHFEDTSEYIYQMLMEV